MKPSLGCHLLLSCAAICVAACDPNVVIGARWTLEEGMAGEAGTPAESWCATAPWRGNDPVLFSGEHGSDIAAGNYLVTYVSGAQIHDNRIGYEVTDYYFGDGGLHAGHHIFSGDSPETGATSLWLDEEGIVASGGTIAEVEAGNRGHSWPLEHAGGELFVTLYDDVFNDNSGPGTRFCIAAVPVSPER